MLGRVLASCNRLLLPYPGRAFLCREVKLPPSPVKAWPCFAAYIYPPGETQVLERGTKGSRNAGESAFDRVIAWSQIACLDNIEASDVFLL